MRKTKLKPATWPEGTGQIGDIAWCCHHAIIIERLTEPAQNRINYIKTGKRERERPVRLAAFMPVDRADLPESFLNEWEQGHALREQGRALWEQGHALWEQGNALREQGHALREQGHALREQGDALWAQGNALEKQAIRAHEDELIAIFHAKCPGVTFTKEYGLVFTEAR